MGLITIKYEKISKNLDKERYEDYCFKCSVCTVCPVNNSEKYRKRQRNKEDLTFIYDIFSAQDPAAKPELWSCSICEACIEVCPQTIEPGHIFADLKEESFLRGLAPKSVYEVMGRIIETGFTFPVSAGTHRNREKLELAPLSSEAVSELEKIAKSTGVQKILMTQK